jgi:hypothetical protein
MAYPDTDQDRRNHGDPYRDSNTVATRSSFNWPLVLGIAIAALLAMTLLGSFGDNSSVTNTPADRPAMQTPSEPPAKAPTPAPTPPTP